MSEIGNRFSLKNNEGETYQEKVRRQAVAALKERLTWDRDSSEDHTNGGNFAVRHAWFGGILAQVQNVAEENLLSTDLTSEFYRLQKKYIDVNYSNSQERKENIDMDIVEMADFAEKVIVELEK